MRSKRSATRGYRAEGCSPDFCDAECSGVCVLALLVIIPKIKDENEILIIKNQIHYLIKSGEIADFTRRLPPTSLFCPFLGAVI